MLNQLRKWRVVLLALGVVLAIALTNCNDTQNTSPATGSSGSTPANTLVYGSTGQPVNLEPGNVTDGNSIIVQQQIYNRLIEFEPGTTNLVPALATAWEASEDGTEWTFTLRQGVKFHDGTDFNAEAVRFNIDRWWNPDSPYGYRDTGKTYEIWAYLFGGYKGDRESLLEDVVVEDDSQIKFILKQPFAAFPAAIAAGYFGIASPSAIQQAGADYGTPSSLAVGTGAFRFQQWRSGDRIVLENNPNYWKSDLPKAEQVIIRFLSDPSARLAELRAGTIDFTVDFSPDQLVELSTDPNLEPVYRPSFNVGYLALNPSYEPLSNLEVRKAIALAINRQAIVEAFWKGLGTTSGHFLPAALDWSYSDNVEDYEYDLEQAKQLLTQAGYLDGFKLDLWYMPVSRPYYPTPKPIAEALAAELSAIGINVNLKTKDWAAYLEDRRKSPGFQAFMLGWTGDYGDPDNFYYPHFGPGVDDLGNWKNERVIELLAAGRKEQNLNERAKIYTEVDEILHQEVVRVPIVHSRPLLGKQIEVRGWQPSPLGSEPFETIEKINPS